MNVKDVIEFVRKKDYKYVKSLGQGALGKTVLLHDDIIDHQFVCKKYSPLEKELKKDYFKNFVTEIKLLYLIHHPNIVRVFNYHMYPEILTGYIIMEYVKGDAIDEYLHKNPENINEIFVQVIEGFSYLEKNGILHRDIRPQNILVTSDGFVKIIDLGFGKKISDPKDFDKSVSLNWRYNPPNELSKGVYDYKTEIYFIAQLFNYIISEEEIQDFKYNDILREMSALDSSEREDSFAKIKLEISQEKFDESDFSSQGKQVYLTFANSLSRVITKLESGRQYFFDVDRILSKLKILQKKVILEDYIQHNPDLIKCFIKGECHYKSSVHISVDELKSFVQLLNSCSKEKRNIIIDGLHSRFDSVDRIGAFDELPF